MELAMNNHPSVRQFIVMARFMCYYLFFTGHMPALSADRELHDKIISSICTSKLADFVMFVSSSVTASALFF